MRTKVTTAGVLIPKQWFEGVDEVDIRREADQIVVVPVHSSDPVFLLGSDPLDIPLTDASIHHDRYLSEQ